MGPASTVPSTYLHPDPTTALLPLLRRAYLPAALPLVRRLQFHASYPDARIIATIPPDAASGAAHPLLTVLFMDRSRAPETEGWLFSSAETFTTILPDQPGASLATNTSSTITTATSTTSSATAPTATAARANLLAVLAHAARLPLPAAFPSSSNPSFLKIGSMHAVCVALLQGWDGGPVASLAARWATAADRGGNDVVQAPPAATATATAADDTASNSTARPSPDHAAHPRGPVLISHTAPYIKMLVAPERMTAAAAAMEAAPPAGLVWDRTRRCDLALVMARTHIPRTERTLALMPSACLRVAPAEGAADLKDVTERTAWDPATAATTLREAPGRPIGWAFLCPDAALGTLHVEPDYRGRGLGTALARRALGLLGPHGDEAEVTAAAAAAAAAAEREGEGEGEKSGTVTELADVRRGFPGHTRRSEAWGHVDVARDNAASQAVLRAVGGRPAWECFWTVVDVDRAAQLVGGTEATVTNGGTA